jgi:hypothetical protein
VLIVWVLIALYFGVGGSLALDVERRIVIARQLPEDLKKHGLITFRNREMLEARNDEKLSDQIFIYIKYFPKPLLYLITSMAFGAIGSITYLVKEITIGKKKISEVNTYAFPFLGCLIGMLVLGVGNLIPEILVIGETTLDPLSLAFFSLLSGLACEKFFLWLTKINDKIFG